MQSGPVFGPLCIYKWEHRLSCSDVAIGWAGWTKSRGPEFQICRWNCHPICHSSRDTSISGFGGHIATSGCRSSSQSPGVSFFALGVVENPMRCAVGIAVISVILSEIWVLPVWTAALLFPVIRQCHVYLWTPSWSFAWFVYRARITVILTSHLFGCMSLWLWLTVL